MYFVSYVLTKAMNDKIDILLKVLNIISWVYTVLITILLAIDRYIKTFNKNKDSKWVS